MHMDTRQKQKLFFYLDIILLGVGAVALVTLVHDAFYAGYAQGTDAVAFGDYVWRLGLEIGTVLVAMTYFLARFFRVRVKELSNPWG